MILIEGAPGIGKTILSKEIAFQWANKSILKNKRLLFSLFMRDPQVKNVINVQSLVKYFCQSENLTNKITDWLMLTSGKYLTIILDGYDEMSEENKNYFIIDGIIGRKTLPSCGIIITSRPVASLRLHDIVSLSCRAEILGFTEEDRLSFIQNELIGQKDKIKELTDFLSSNPSLNALCYIPLNMSILLCLTEAGINALPKTQTMLYQKFIIMTIIHFLRKDNVIFKATISSLDDLPAPYDQVIKELSEFAFIALQKDQLVFTLAEVKAKCPTLTPSNWYGLGLLKLAQYFKSQDACDHESFHFLHYSMQEYMAAYYIASLKDKELLSLLKETFWDVHYFNTWIMYVGITGGKKITFIQFLSGNQLLMSKWLSGPKISNKIVNDKIRCLHLLHCSTEADCEILLSVENIFQEQIIDLSNTSLSINNMHTLAMLLLRLPNKQWEKLNLSGCNINDDGCDSLCEIFVSKNVSFSIKSVDLSNNNIQWEALCKLCEVLQLWHTEELIITIDALYGKITMIEIEKFKSELYEGINHRLFIGKQFSGRILCTHMANQQIMLVTYSNQHVIKCDRLYHCKLNEMTISNIGNLIKQVSIEHISFSYRFPYDELHIKSTTLSQYINKVKFCGYNMHSKGAFMISVPSNIQYSYSLPHQIADDFVTAVICHNIQSESSYLTAIPTILCPAIKNSLEIIHDMEKITLTDNNIDEKAADDIAALYLIIIINYENYV